VQSASSQQATKPTEALGSPAPHSRRTWHATLASAFSAGSAAVSLAELATRETVLSLSHHGEAVVVAEHQKTGDPDTEKHQKSKGGRSYADRPTPAMGGRCLVPHALPWHGRRGVGRRGSGSRRRICTSGGRVHDSRGRVLSSRHRLRRRIAFRRVSGRLVGRLHGRLICHGVPFAAYSGCLSPRIAHQPVRYRRAR
jgi:hypothetical protein